MRNRLLSGTACAALCLVSFSGAARSATLDDVMARLDKIERENAELERSNNQKAARVTKLESDRSTLEIEIRKILGMKKENETVFKDSSPMPANGGGTPSPAPTDH